MKRQKTHSLNEPLTTIWGGLWTEEKLDAFEKYVRAYLTIMNKYRDQYEWTIIYFDGFAGSGARTIEEQKEEIQSTINLFDGEIEEQELNVYRGAAERVLRIGDIRNFDKCYFIEKNKENSLQLKQLLENSNEGDCKFFVLNDDANASLGKLAKLLLEHRNIKALVLLDPFGMQINWDSIAQLKDLSVDLWILIPTGVIVNRLLERRYNEESGLAHAEKLESFFGMDRDEIVSQFYDKRVEKGLFDDEVVTISKTENSIRKIAELYIKRLESIFLHVTPEPLVLYNSRKCPIYHFAFASNNPNAVKIAKDIIAKR